MPSTRKKDGSKPQEAMTEEEEEMIRQQRADLDNSRITSLPLSDRINRHNRQGPHAPYQPRFGGPGDSRLIMGPRPGGPPPRPSVPSLTANREERQNIEARWADLFDPELVPDREDGLGGGNLYRQRQRRNSFSHPNERPPLVIASEAFKSPNTPSEFRRGGRGGGAAGNINFRGRENFPLESSSPVRGRPIRGGFVPRAGAAVRVPRAVARSNSGDRKWGTNLVTNQGDFFDSMLANTGLKIPTGKTPSASPKPIAKPMKSFKDLASEDLVAKPPSTQPTASPVPAPINSVRPGFVPPHLRHTLKRSEDKADQAKTSQTAVSEPSPAPPKRIERKPSPALTEGRISSPFQLQDRGSRSEIDELPKLRSPSPARLQSSSHLGVEEALDWHREFWKYLGRPMWEHLLQDYKDVRQQLTFLSSYYGSHREEWEDIRNNGPPSPERIVEITHNRFKEIFKQLAQDKRESDDDLMDDILHSASKEEQDQAAEIGKIAPLPIHVPGPIFSAPMPVIQLSEENLEVIARKIRGDHDKKEENHQRAKGKKAGRRTPGRLTPPDFSGDIQAEFDKLKIGSPSEQKTGLPAVTNPNLLAPSRHLHQLSPLSKFATEFEEQSGDGGVTSHLKRSSHAPAIHNSNNQASGGKVATPKPRDDSNERRKKEKEEAMRRINLEFAEMKAKKAGNHRGTDGHQEVSPAKTDLDSKGNETDLIDLNSGVDVSEEKLRLEDMQSSGLSDTRNDVPDIDAMLQEAQEAQELEEPIPTNKETSKPRFNPDDLYNAKVMLEHLPPMDAEQLKIQREINRAQVESLAERHPWGMTIKLSGQSTDAGPVAVHLKCTDNMPYSFVQNLRNVVGAKEWQGVIKHPEFRGIVMDATKKFYGKMAAKWGQQFAYGVAK